MDRESDRKPFNGGRGRGGLGRGGANINRSKSRGFENREPNTEKFQNKSRGRMSNFNGNEVNERFESRNRKIEVGMRGRVRDQSQANSEKRDLRPTNFIRDVESRSKEVEEQKQTRRDGSQRQSRVRSVGNRYGNANSHSRSARRDQLINVDSDAQQLNHDDGLEQQRPSAIEISNHRQVTLRDNDTGSPVYVRSNINEVLNIEVEDEKIEEPLVQYDNFI